MALFDTAPRRLIGIKQGFNDSLWLRGQAKLGAGSGHAKHQDHPAAMAAHMLFPQNLHGKTNTNVEEFFALSDVHAKPERPVVAIVYQRTIGCPPRTLMTPGFGARKSGVVF